MLTWPEVPTGTMTRLGTVLPPTQFKFEESGRTEPVGQTVKKLCAVVSVTVTFKATADTPLAGTPPPPVTWTSNVPPGVKVPGEAPSWLH